MRGDKNRARTKNYDKNAVKKIAIIAYDNCWAMSVFSVKDFFRIVALLEKHLGLNNAFDVNIITFDGQEVIAAGGNCITPCAALSKRAVYDFIIVPPMEGPALIANQWRSSNITHCLINNTHENSLILGLTTGVGLLADAGIVDGKLLATHWAFLGYFRKEFPKCQFIAHNSYLQSNNYFTTGSMNGCFDALLAFVCKVRGDAFMQLCATHLLIDDPHRVNPVLPGHRNHHDNIVLRTQDWLENNFASEFTISDLAIKFGASERNLKRRFQKATDISIIHYLQKVRVDKAKKLLISTRSSIKEIAYEVGYENVSFFIRLFKRSTGLTPSQWRDDDAWRP